MNAITGEGLFNLVSAINEGLLHLEEQLGNDIAFIENARKKAEQELDQIHGLDV